MKTIIHTMDISVPREQAFGALTTLPGLAAWWTTDVTGDPALDGQVKFAFADPFNPVMLVTGVTEPSRVEWECVGGVEQWAENTFLFDLSGTGGSTRLRFRQEYATELSDDYYGSYNFNWGFYLNSLRQYLETGTGQPYPLSVPTIAARQG